MLVEDLLGAPAQIADLDSLRAAFPWVDRYNPATLQEGLTVLQRTCGSLIVPSMLAKAEDADLIGGPTSFEAARWIFGGDPAPQDERRALVAARGDSVVAALTTQKQPNTPANRAAVLAWSRAAVRKPAEFDRSDYRVVSGDEPAASEVSEAVRSGGVRRLSGDVLAVAGAGGPWLLRRTDEAPRAAAFHKVAESFGLGHYVPAVCAVTIDGALYVAERPPGRQFSPLSDREGRNAPRMALASALSDGSLHRLAALDYVCGNPDRSDASVLVDDRGRLLLVRNEGSFSASFDPAGGEAFPPAYLTAWGEWPAPSSSIEPSLASWLNGLRDEALRSACARRNLDFAPCLGRLEALRRGTASAGLAAALRAAWAS